MTLQEEELEVKKELIGVYTKYREVLEREVVELGNILRSIESSFEDMRELSFNLKGFVSCLSELNVELSNVRAEVHNLADAVSVLKSSKELEEVVDYAESNVLL